MPDLELLSKIVTGILAVSTFVAIALVGLMVGTIRTLRDSNADLRLRGEDLEKARDERDKELAALELKIVDKAAENRLLSSMVQGRVDWTAISDQLEHHHTQAVAYWEKTGDDLTAIRHAFEEGK